MLEALILIKAIHRLDFNGGHVFLRNILEVTGWKEPIKLRYYSACQPLTGVVCWNDVMYSGS